jgi:hypothetical protein
VLALVQKESLLNNFSMSWTLNIPVTGALEALESAAKLVFSVYEPVVEEE